MKKFAIAKATERFCKDSEHCVGFCLETFPTGFGKSYEAEYAMLKMTEDDPSLKIIFITDQTKNLPYDDLERIAKNELGISSAKFKKKVLRIKSNLDCVVENYTEEMRQHILSLFKEFDIPEKDLKDLLKTRSLYKKHKNSNTDPKFLEQLRADFDFAESTFRFDLHRILKNIKTPEERLQLIEEDPNYSWIRKLYPVVDFDSYQILLMSDAKFVYTIDPIIAAPFTIWSETDLKKPQKKNGSDDEDTLVDVDDVDTGVSRLSEHLIIIDEFDTFKKVIQNALVDEQKDELDAVRAFRNLNLKLSEWKNLPAIMLNESKWWISTKRRSITTRFKKLIEAANKIRTKYHMEYLFKQFGVDENGNLIEHHGSSFMFKDYEPYSIGNAFTLRTNPDERYNNILTGKNIASTGSKISWMLNSINELFNNMAKLVRDLAFNYMYLLDGLEKKATDGSNVARFRHGTFSNCVESVIDAFDMESDVAHFIKNKVVHNRLKTGVEKKLALKDPIVFGRGFSYTSMRDSQNKSFQTHLYYTDYDMTPETVLKHMAERTKVIGLSATGDIESPVCNFNLQYLRDTGVYFHEFNKEEVDSFDEILKDARWGYDEGKCKLNCIPLPTVPDYNRAVWEDILGDEDEADALFRDLGGLKKDKNVLIRYVRATQALEQFFDHEDIRSMIGFFSAQVNSDGDFNINDMNAIIKRLSIKHGIAIQVEWAGEKPKIFNEKAGDISAHIVQIKGSNFDTVKDDVLERLAGTKDGMNGVGQKIFLMTAYQTLGAGQNLQHGVSTDVIDDMVCVRHSQFERGLEIESKDFDAAYLDEPTSIAPLIEFGKKGTLDHYLFYIEYLDAINQITIQQKHTEVKNAFRCCYTPNLDVQPSHMKMTEAYLLAKAKVINQAVGRICRTAWKRRNTYLFVDSELIYEGTFALEKECYGSLLSYEFEKLYDSVHEMQEFKAPDDHMQLIIDEGIRMSHNFVRYLDDLRYAVYDGDFASIDKWKELRDFVLHHPTCPQEMDGLDKIQNMLHRFGYIEPPHKSNSYHFSLKNDFDPFGTDELDIAFDKIPPKLKRKDLKKMWYDVSAEQAKLDLICCIDYVRDYLVQEKIPTSFEPNDKIMSPPLFRNIYMGGLGEIVGKTILEHYLNEPDTANEIKLQELDESIYERFDYCLNGIYYDFKDWNESCYGDDKQTEMLLKKIGDKLLECVLYEKGVLGDESYAPKSNECEGRTVYLINIVVNGSVEYLPTYEYDLSKGGKAIVVPYLYIVKNGRTTPNVDFINKLKEEILDE